ncbi:hypothetical protein BDU57DRAFT_310928 [Ampelomyces quisqualis]|uniref:Uncharacterized protein n=1 Tax=Ampelomyces quisqualis TaxID=50730 RepID=A0A6A5QJK8_AMPQU|nr:hypothetical protein BDU57DRAFT_310928 [Ampelomyces quisqualis]
MSNIFVSSRTSLNRASSSHEVHQSISSYFLQVMSPAFHAPTSLRLSYGLIDSMDRFHIAWCMQNVRMSTGLPAGFSKTIVHYGEPYRLFCVLIIKSILNGYHSFMTSLLVQNGNLSRPMGARSCLTSCHTVKLHTCFMRKLVLQHVDNRTVQLQRKCMRKLVLHMRSWGTKLDVASLGRRPGTASVPENPESLFEASGIETIYPLTGMTRSTP